MEKLAGRNNLRSLDHFDNIDVDVKRNIGRECKRSAVLG
jgi:hypothetical protein